MNKPTQSVLNDNDAVFFYKNAAKLSSELEHRKNISALASKFGITITFAKGPCKKFTTEADSITIYGPTSNQNKTFFRHLRNAFAHLYIEVANSRCKLLDWKQYENGKLQQYTARRITMHGDVDYAKFKDLLQEFFSETSKTK